MDWMRVAADVGDHPKSRKLGALLGRDRAHSYVIDLWGWATRFHPDGDLSDADDLDIALACRWDGEPSTFVAALIEARLLDVDGDLRLVHDWPEHQGKMIEQAAAAADRARQWRERMKAVRATNGKRTHTLRAPNYLRTNERNEHTDEQKDETTLSPTGDDGGLQKAFLEFWSAYPRKVGKGNAIKAWQRITSPAPLLPVMLKALEWQTKSADWTKDGGQFIPHPATWLNGRRWEDERPQQEADPLTVLRAEKAAYGADQRWPAYENLVTRFERRAGTWSAYCQEHP